MPKGKLVSASIHPLAAKIREAIGAGQDEVVEIITPQFERRPTDPHPACCPATREEWEALRALDVTALRELGLGSWDGGLFLFPGEWFRFVPPGFEVECISGEIKPWGVGMDDDIRFGLAYGIRIGPATDGGD